jgi:cellulose synthase/poly-beta-1,6-N-acetylglucosamine synthase-like glycosyltransferase
MRPLIAGVVIAAVVLLSLRRAAFLVAALLPARPQPKDGPLPTVTVLVPARNERTVAERLLGSLARLEYPREKLSFVLVCDGCTDDTPAAFRAWAGARSNCRVLERKEREGKAAALNAGLGLVDAEIVAVVDADLAPQPLFLRELVRPFADEEIGAAAGFLRPANADDNLVTRYAAVTTWVHQLVTSAGTDRLGLSPPTLGAAAFRRAALEQIGGFPVAPAGVDVATSSALIRAGWRTRFVASAVADNTVVSSARDYWRQHVRWSRAVFRVPSADKRKPATSWAQRLELSASSLGYGDRLVFAVALGGALVGMLSPWVPGLYLSVPGLGIVAALLQAGVGAALPRFLFATGLFFGADLAGSVAAVVQHVADRPYRWHNPRQVRDAKE